MSLHLNLKRFGYITLLLCVASALITLASLHHFKKSKTTVDPIHLEKNNNLMTDGIFKFSRNPIYLSFVILLLACTYFLANLLNLAVVAAFIIFIPKAFRITGLEVLNSFADQGATTQHSHAM